MTATNQSERSRTGIVRIRRKYTTDRDLLDFDKISRAAILLHLHRDADRVKSFDFYQNRLRIVGDISHDSLVCFGAVRAKTDYIVRFAIVRFAMQFLVKTH